MRKGLVVVGQPFLIPGEVMMQMAQSFQQMGQQQPELLGQLLGPSGLMSNPLARMALTGIAGLAAKQMMGQGARGPTPG